MQGKYWLRDYNPRIPYKHLEKIVLQLKNGNRFVLTGPQWRALDDMDLKVESTYTDYRRDPDSVTIWVSNDIRRKIIKYAKEVGKGL